MMKKLICMILAAALLLAAGAPSALAAHHGQGRHTDARHHMVQADSGCVSKDRNGACATADVSGCLQCGDTDGDGVCNRCGKTCPAETVGGSSRSCPNRINRALCKNGSHHQ